MSADSAVQIDASSVSPWNDARAAGWAGGAVPRRLHLFFENRCDATPDKIALICNQQTLTYRELDARANQLAHYLSNRGAGAGERVGILLERSVECYVALLAALKSGSAFVPIDPSYPPERNAYIAQDAGLAVLLTSAALRPRAAGLGCATLAIDAIAEAIAAQPAVRLPAGDQADDALCYIIYTSGTTGRPKGVAVNHSSICNFLSVCAPVYGYTSSDRVYQGMILAFDFSIEEIWPTFIAGGTLVAGPTDHRRLGSGLRDFLNEHQVTVLCCVPTLLATIDGDVPSLRLVMVGGEACPADLVYRWSRPGRRMLNTYGPTETTVSATWCELHPGRAVTIGKPFPTYSAHVLDESLRPLPPGQPGEICIGGPGVARGYVNRPELTAQKFVPDPFASGGRLYRTGDLGRVCADGQIEFLGRIDSQVKIRGYRIELSEIETLLMENPAVENAVVSAIIRPGGMQELAAYITLRKADIDRETLLDGIEATLHQRLPAYMAPAFIEILSEIPTLPNGKTDRSALPAPRSARRGGHANGIVPPQSALEQRLADEWREIFSRQSMSVEDDFFLDLQGHSLFAAVMISRLRKKLSLPWLAVADLYAHPTIRALARHIETTAAGHQAAGAAHATAATPARQPKPVARRHGTGRVWTCGIAQMALIYLLLGILGSPVAAVLAGGAYGAKLILLSATIIPAASLIMVLALPILAKWVLVGKFKPGVYPLWGWYYCRWWLLRKINSLAPLDFLAGSPLMSVYLRLLGAKVGRDCHIGSAGIDVPDLIEIGDRVSIGYQAELQPYTVEDGWLRLFPIRVGNGAFIGTNAVLSAGAAVGDGARVADQTLVACDQTIPPGQTWAGSPAARVPHGNPLLDEMSQRPMGRWSAGHWVAFIIGAIVLEFLPLIATVPGWVLVAWCNIRHGLLASLAMAPIAAAIMVLSVCAVVAAGKRLLVPRVQPGIYPLRSWFGVRKWFVDKLMSISLEATNTLYATLYSVPWLRLLGTRVGKWAEVSTVSHIDPDLLTLGDDSFVADMASIGAATYCNGAIALGPTALGRRCFVGNSALIPINTSLGDDSLIGVQSVPPARPVEKGTSWLGSPSIFLPHRQQNWCFDEKLTYRPPKRLVACRLAIEFLRVTLPATLMYAFGLLAILVSLDLASKISLVWLMLALPGVYLAAGLATVILVSLMKWAVVGRYRPRVEPHWSHFVWRTEMITGLYESAAVPALIGWMTGTPMIAPLLRLFGVKIGRRVWMDTTYITEFDLVDVGDDAAIGDATSLQTHLYEDRVMKMSTVIVGPGCCVGSRSVVLYDSSMEANSRLDALSLVMKGETLPPDTEWRGIPARMVD